jgi:hypothetical protein
VLRPLKEGRERALVGRDLHRCRGRLGRAGRGAGGRAGRSGLALTIPARRPFTPGARGSGGRSPPGGIGSGRPRRSAPLLRHPLPERPRVLAGRAAGRAGGRGRRGRGRRGRLRRALRVHRWWRRRLCGRRRQGLLGRLGRRALADDDGAGAPGSLLVRHAGRLIAEARHLA